MIFVDTSALYAILDHDDQNHQHASQIWTYLLQADEPLVTHNYIQVETCALLQRRLGIQAVGTFQFSILPMLTLYWVSEQIHQLAIAALLAANSNKVSFVDRVSFQVMRQQGYKEAFAFDQDFVTEGFLICRI